MSIPKEQFELVFGAIFLRGLSQLRQHAGVEDSQELGMATGRVSGGAGYMSYTGTATGPGHYNGPSSGRSGGVRWYKDRELEVCSSMLMGGFGHVGGADCRISSMPCTISSMPALYVLVIQSPVGRRRVKDA